MPTGQDSRYKRSGASWLPRSLRMARLGSAVALILAFCAAATDAEAQTSDRTLTDPLRGPSTTELADYAYLSFVAVFPQQPYDLHYELCNRRTDENLAFSWPAAGFEVTIINPLPPNMCALYERSAPSYAVAPSATLYFSAGNQSAKTYVACIPENAGQCDGKQVQITSPSFHAKLSTTVLHKPTGTAWPLQITAWAYRNSDRSMHLIVTWAAKTGKFALGFPASAADDGALKAAIKVKEGSPLSTFYSYKDFPELKGSPFVGDASEIHVAQIANASEAAAGRWDAYISSEPQLGRVALILVLNPDNKISAVFVLPLP